MSDTVKRNLKGFGAGLAVALLCVSFGHLIGIDMTFIAGWLSCRIFYEVAGE